MTGYLKGMDKLIFDCLAIENFRSQAKLPGISTASQSATQNA